METTNGIKSWAPDDRPREKLNSKGPGALSDSELLAILLGSGNRQESAVSLARRILASVENDLVSLGRIDLNALKKFKGMGDVKSLTLIAALELGRRRRSTEARELPVIGHSKGAYEHFLPHIGDLAHEEFWVMNLTRRNHVISVHKVSEGGISYTAVDPKKVFGIALENKSSSIIVAHNHPSGNTQPSDEDLKLTRRLVNAGKNLELPVLDHLIVTSTGYYSFADEGTLEQA
ncbi:MAG: DNA repair protein RadC [Flavobacteriales bacterium]|nr:DNA repair protein RadC [Flavobacteriales bacterium]